MKSTGITRKLDPLGRIVLPKELRRTLNLNENDPIEIFTEQEAIILRKYNPGCKICGSLDNVHEIDGIKLCYKHLKSISKAAKALEKEVNEK